VRTLALFPFLASVLWAQPPADPGMIRGTVIERDPGLSGEFAVRAADHYVFRYRFDPRTVADRNHESIDIPNLLPGEQVEVDSDPPGDEPLRYARAVHVTATVPAPVKRTPPPARGLQPYSAQAERLRPKGDLDFSGVIVRLDGAHLVLRTRAGEQTILLRQDTRYLENGAMVVMAALKPMMRVFVSGGKNLYGDVEGYQVVWGSILEVH
jgi:hypothetical protein